MVDHKTAGPITFYRSTVMTADRGLITALQITGTEVAVLSDPGRAGTTFAVFRPNYRSWGTLDRSVLQSSLGMWEGQPLKQPQVLQA